MAKTSDQTSVSDQVRRIRSGVLSRHGIDSDAGIPPDLPESSALEDATGLMHISAHWGIASDLPVIGRVLVLIRRSIRIALRWYINPIVDQQNAFNEATVRALYELRSENDDLRARFAAKGSASVDARQGRE